MFEIRALKQQLQDLIWTDKAETHRPSRSWLIWVARVIYVLVRDVTEGQLTLRAMSLVYTTLLSLVPLLAVSFSVLKGFGVQNQLKPTLLEFLAPMGERGVEIADRIMGFVSNVNAGVLGSLGLVLLFYTVVSLMQKIEHAFNYVWRVSNARNLAQRFSDYLSVIIIGPVLVFAAIGLTVSAQSTEIVAALRSLPFAGLLFDALGYLMPYFMVVIAFTIIYIFVPNTRIKWKSALLGGAVAGILWQTTGWVFAAFVVNSAKYIAIYSAFASVILFMIWLYAGWLILLVGSSIAFYHQHPEHLRLSHTVPRLGNRARETLALQIGLLVGTAFKRGEPPLTRSDLAHSTGVPEETIGYIVNALCWRHVLREINDPPGLVLARPLAQVTLANLIEAVRVQDLALGDWHITIDSAVDRMAGEVDSAIVQTLATRTLHDLVEAAAPDVTAPAP
ncbi:MAG: YhjD/YihY/BrkB family envelope integrity protein [Gammaproteobacteria bacterium]